MHMEQATVANAGLLKVGIVIDFSMRKLFAIGACFAWFFFNLTFRYLVWLVRQIV